MKRALVSWLLVFAALVAGAQDLPPQPFAFKWKAVSGAGGYRVEVRDDSGIVVTENLEAAKTSMTLNLVPGPYELRLTTLNRLMKDEQSTAWQAIHVAAPSAPVISGLESSEVLIGYPAPLEFTVSGLARDGTLALRSPTGKLTPLLPEAGRVTFDVSALSERGDWTVVATNPPKLTVSVPAFSLHYPKPTFEAGPWFGGAGDQDQPVRLRGHDLSSELVVTLEGQGLKKTLRWRPVDDPQALQQGQSIEITVPAGVGLAEYSLRVANAIDEPSVTIGVLKMELPDDGQYARASTVVSLASTSFWYGMETGSMALAADGRLFIAGNTTNQIFVVGSDRKISPYLGTQKSGNSDGGTPTFRMPRGVAAGSDGTLYVADTGNYSVRKIAPNKTVTTWGSGEPGTNDGKGKEASFMQPTALTVDRWGVVWVVDQAAGLIRKITPDGTVSTALGRAGVKLSRPRSLVVEPSGYLDVLDGAPWRIRRFAPDGTAVTLAEAAPGGTLVDPQSLCAAPDGSLIVADGTGHRVWNLSKRGKLLLLAGAAAAGNTDGLERLALFDAPMVLASADAAVYVADLGSNVSLRSMTLPMSLTNPPAPMTFTSSAKARGLDYPQAIAFSSGEVFVADGNRILKGPSVDELSPWVDKKLPATSGLAVDAAGTVYLADSVGNSVLKVSSSGIATIVAAGLQGPRDVVFGGDGVLLVSEAGARRIVKVSAEGKVTSFATGFVSPGGMAVDRWGNVFVIDSNQVKKISPQGQVAVLAGDKKNGPSLRSPQGIAVDGEGNVYVSEAGGNDILLISPAGQVSVLAGTGTPGFEDGPLSVFSRPTGLAIGDANLYVADSMNQRIRRISLRGETAPVEPSQPLATSAFPRTIALADGPAAWAGIAPLFVGGPPQGIPGFAPTVMTAGYLAYDKKYLTFMLTFADGTPSSGSDNISYGFNMYKGEGSLEGRLQAVFNGWNKLNPKRIDLQSYRGGNFAANLSQGDGSFVIGDNYLIVRIPIAFFRENFASDQTYKADFGCFVPNRPGAFWPRKPIRLPD